TLLDEHIESIVSQPRLSFFPLIAKMLRVLEIEPVGGPQQHRPEELGAAPLFRVPAHPPFPLFDAEALAALSGLLPLSAIHLVDLAHHGGQPLAESPLKGSEVLFTVL